MTEVKFACPVCGQHITCAAAKSGTRMACPTCYRELQIPQAATVPGKLILSAVEAQSRPAAAPPAGLLPLAAGRKWSFVPAILLVLFLLTVGTAAYVFREKLFRVQNPTQGEPAPAGAAVKPPLQRASSDADSLWTQDLAAVRIPASPASGRVHGYSFIADRATLARGSLTLRQGSGWPAELAVAITLAAARGEDLAGKVVTNLPNRRGSPPITLRWREPDGRMAAESLRAGYVLRLEFGSVHDRSIEGKLYLATADAEKSFVGGTFRAEIRPAAAPRNLPAR